MKSRTLPLMILVAMLMGAVSAVPAAAQPLASSRAGSSGPDRRAMCPLTGRPVPDGTNPKRAAVAVKIDNTNGQNDQSGLAAADIVIEHPVEGGATRFSAVYHCKDAASVGPVRSARMDDARLLAGLTDVLAYSGANRIVARELKRSGMTSITEEHDSAFARLADREAPFDLFGSTRAIRSAADGGSRPTRLFDFGRLPRGAAKAKTVDLSFGGTNVSFDWIDGAWHRSQDGVPFAKSDGGRSAIANVLVQVVQVDESQQIYDALGNPSPEMALEGRGRALLFRDGSVISGSWRSRHGVVEFKRKDGSAMTFDAGQTWWEIVPSGNGSVKGSLDY